MPAERLKPYASIKSNPLKWKIKIHPLAQQTISFAKLDRPASRVTETKTPARSVLSRQSDFDGQKKIFNLHKQFTLPTMIGRLARHRRRQTFVLRQKADGTSHFCEGRCRGVVVDSWKLEGPITIIVIIPRILPSVRPDA